MLTHSCLHGLVKMGVVNKQKHPVPCWFMQLWYLELIGADTDQASFFFCVWVEVYWLHHHSHYSQYSCCGHTPVLLWRNTSADHRTQCALVWGFLTTFTTQLMILVRDTSPQLPVHKQNKTNSLSFCPWLTQTGSCSLPQQDYSWNQHTSESPAWLILTGSRYSLYTSQYLHSKT